MVWRIQYWIRLYIVHMIWRIRHVDKDEQWRTNVNGRKGPDRRNQTNGWRSNGCSMNDNGNRMDIDCDGHQLQWPTTTTTTIDNNMMATTLDMSSTRMACKRKEWICNRWKTNLWFLLVLVTMERLSSLLTTKYKRKRCFGLAWFDDDDDVKEFLSKGNWFKGRQHKNKQLSNRSLSSLLFRSGSLIHWDTTTESSRATTITTTTTTSKETQETQS